jgi:hypothetical protein
VQVNLLASEFHPPSHVVQTSPYVIPEHKYGGKTGNSYISRSATHRHAVPKGIAALMVLPNRLMMPETPKWLTKLDGFISNLAEIKFRFGGRRLAFLHIDRRRR